LEETGVEGKIILELILK